jgi:rubredoxin
MKKWYCLTCDFVYDEALGLPEFGIKAGTQFKDLPDDWTCPECGSPKDYFELRD